MQHKNFRFDDFGDLLVQWGVFFITAAKMMSHTLQHLIYARQDYLHGGYFSSNNAEETKEPLLAVVEFIKCGQW